MKQINKTEGNIQSTDIAEMGAIYFKTKINDTIALQNNAGAETINDYFTTINNQLNVIETKKPISKDDVYFEIKTIGDISKYSLPPTATIKLLPNNMTTYLNKDARIIGILLNSKGIKKNETRSLSIHLKYLYKLDTNGNYAIAHPGSITSPIKCGDPSQISGIQCLYTTPQSFEGDLQNIKDSTLYFEDDFNVSGTIVNVQGGKIHVEGDFVASEINNFQDITEDKVSVPSELEVEGDAQIGIINNTFNDFKLFVGGDLTVNQIGNSVRDSTFIVLGTATIKSGLENINGDCKLCAYNGVTGYVNDPTDKIYVPEDPDFNTQCSLYGGPTKYILQTTPDEMVEYH